MGQVVAGVVLPVEFHRADIGCGITVVVGLDEERFPVLQVQGCLLEKRGSQHILVGTRAHRVETQSREDVPGRGLAVVLVAAIAVGGGGIELVHDVAHVVLRLPGFARVVVEVDQVLYGLVAVGILAHVHHLHLAHLVNHVAAIHAQIAGYDKDRVHHVVEGRASTHQVDEPLRVVEDTEAPMPAVPFAEVIAPVGRPEVGVEVPPVVASHHESLLGIIDVAVVEAALLVDVGFAFGAAQPLAQRVDAPVVVGIFERAGHTLSHQVTGYIAQAVVGLESHAARGRPFELGVGAVFHRLPQFVDVVAADSLDVGIGHDRGRVVADHAVAVSRAGPFGQEPALAIGVDQSLLHLLVHRGVDEVEQGEERTEGVPETGIGK